MHDTERWQDVADAINDRMLHLALTQRALSERSGVSLSTLRELQHGVENRRRSARTLAALSDALGWQPDHLQRVAEGETRQPADTAHRSLRDHETLTEPQQIQQNLTELSDRVDRLARRYLDPQPR